MYAAAAAAGETVPGLVIRGNLEVARNPAQAERLREEFEEDRSWGIDDVELLTAAEARARVDVDSLVLDAVEVY